MKNNITIEQKKKIDDIVLDYNKTKSFFHCAHCVENFMGSPLHEVMTPSEYGMYEVGKYPFTYPDNGKADIVVVWCKRCGRSVWDSRDLTKLY